MFTFGGLFHHMYLFSGFIDLKGKGKVFKIVLNLSVSPYFSLIGNLGIS